MTKTYFQQLELQPKEHTFYKEVEWPGDFEELIFSSSTCFISTEAIEKEINMHKYGGFDFWKRYRDIIIESFFDKKQSNAESEKELQMATADSIKTTSVKVEVFDYKWVFEKDNTDGEDKKGTWTLIGFLADLENLDLVV